MIRSLRLLKPRRFFSQLLTTYTVLVVMLTLLIGTAAYISSTRLFTREVTRLNQDVLEQYAALMEKNVFSKAEMLYHNIITTPTIKSDVVAFTKLDFDDLARISGIHKDFTMLASSASNIDFLESLHFYDRGKNLIISSKYGLKYLSQYSLGDYPWLELMETDDISSIWISDPQNPHAISFLSAFPRSSGSDNCAGYLVIDVKRSYVDGLLGAYNQSNSSHMILLDSQTSLASPTDGPATRLRSQAANILPTSSGSATAEIGGIPTVVTNRLFTNGWQLVAFKAVDSFFAGSLNNQRILMLFCALALIAGMGAALLFARKVYSPLAGVVALLRRIFTNRPLQENEFAFINASISTLSSQVDQLHEKLLIHRPLIKYNLLSGLVNGTIVTRRDLEEKLGMLGVDLKGESGYCLLIIELDEKPLREEERDSLHFLRYDLCERLELRPGVLASELTDCRIVALFEPAQSGSAEEIALALLADVYDSYGIRPTICITEVQNSPFTLAEAYEQARRVLALRYYLPDQSPLRVWEHLPADTPDETLWGKLLAQFESALSAREIAPSLQALEQAVQALAKQRLSAEDRQRLQDGFTTALRAAFRQQRQPFALHELVHAPRLSAYHQIMARLCRELCERGKTSGEEKAEAVMSYINAHLGYELTLDHLADRFGLSKSYLSRMFKKNTGLNLSNYVNRMRLLHARKLLDSTQLNIEEVAQQAGFLTPHYFSRKYKQAFGVSPSDYRFQKGKVFPPDDID